MEIFSAIADSSYAENYLQNLGNQLQYNKDILSLIKNYLCQKKSRGQGLIFLHAILPNCTPDIFDEHALFWIDICLKECQLNETSVLGLKILTKLLHACKEFSDLHKYISTNYLPKIIQTIYSKNSKSQESLLALNCLRICLKDYPGQCGFYKNNIEKYLLEFIDSLDSNEIRLVSNCLHSLQQVSGGGSQGIIHKTQWKNQHDSLCETLHSLFNIIFEYVVEIHDVESNSNQLILPELSTEDNRVIQINKLTVRFNNCATFLRYMLIEPFPVTKKVTVDKIMNIIRRVFSINSSVISTEESLDSAVLGMVIPLIHKNMLQLIDALILCLGTNILPYSGIICKILIDTLENASTGLPQNMLSYRHLKNQVYTTLSIWASSIQSASCINKFSDVLIPIIINDIKLHKSECVLISQNNKFSSKKSKKKNQQKSTEDHNNLTETKSDIRNHLNQTHMELCIHALKAVQQVIKSMSTLLQPSIHKVLQETVIKQVLEFKKDSENRHNSSKEYYKQLLNTLIALTINSHPTLPSPTTYTLDILSTGQNDIDLEIGQICSNGLSILEKVIHPCAQTLYFTPNPTEISKYSIDLQQSIPTNKSSKTESELSTIEMKESSFSTIDIKENSDNESIIEINSDDSAENISQTNINLDKDQLAMKEVMEQHLEQDNSQVNKEPNISTLNSNVSELSHDVSIIDHLSGVWDVRTEVLTPPGTNCEKNIHNTDVANLRDLNENSADSTVHVSQNVNEANSQSIHTSQKEKMSHISETVNDISNHFGREPDVKKCKLSNDFINTNGDEKNVIDNDESGDELKLMLSAFVDID